MADLQLKYKRPQCPHCGEIAPYGESRVYWIHAHLDDWLHRWIWKLRKVFRR